MATNFVRGTCFFYDQSSFIPSGWSETHFLRTPDLDLQQAIPILQSYAVKRQQLLANGIQITYLRVSNDNVFRDSQIVPGISPLLQAPTMPFNLLVPITGSQASGSPGPGQLAQNPAFTTLEADMDWTAVLMRGEGGAPYTARSMFWVAGLPDNLTFHSLRGITDPTWTGFFQTWATELTTNWGFLGQDNSANNPVKAIQNVTQTGTPVIVTVVCNSHGFQSGQQVSIRGVRTILNQGKQVNAIWQIQVIDNNTFTLLGSGGLPTFTYLSTSPGGGARLRNKVLIPYAKVLQRRFGSRKRGRPFGLLSGRRRHAPRLLVQGAS